MLLHSVLMSLSDFFSRTGAVGIGKGLAPLPCAFGKSLRGEMVLVLVGWPLLFGNEVEKCKSIQKHRRCRSLRRLRS